MDSIKDNNIALFVPSCDAFCDISVQFFRFFDKFVSWWDMKKYLIVENQNLMIPDVTIIRTGNDVNWTFRMKRALKEIKEEYLLFLLDDYFIGDPVSERDITEAYALMKKENLRYYRFNNRPRVKGLNKQYRNYDYLLSIQNNIRYGIVLGEGIYRRDFFEEMLGEEDKSIWRVETDRLINVENNNGDEIPGCVVDNRNILCTYNGVLKGQWIPATIRHFDEIGLPIELGNRKIQSKGSQIYRRLCGIADKHLSPKQIRVIKSVASKLGVKFTTNQ